ncbi:pyridoxal phosphate-dependent decarboxylase family protein [Agromyces agglutinans]|uniref:pyridoxal phosphate-dependent decarboxylase family protein n=1 Tax=Agromyces agglutinans TaxID=2662258 RepID=UPI0028AC083D|nr:pyridoxal-dependent decarboxylase [Agromyces agglutinans]
MPHILTAATADDYASSTTEVVRRLAGRFRTTAQPFSGASRTELQALVDAVDLDAAGVGTNEALRELDDLFVRHAVWFHAPAYLAHLNCPVAVPAVAAEAIVSAVNASLDTYDQSTAGTLMERRLIEWTASRIGFAAGDGVFTSGGTLSNLQALLLAREAAVARAAAELGLSRPETLARLVVFATGSSHFSVQKSTLLLGLGDDAVELVPVDGDGRMRPDRLAESVDGLIAAGRIPMAVVATAGTTDRGCIDPLAAIADICDREGVWLHVDAAYGCGLLVSATRRHLLDGIERARSVTVDYHKSFFQPVSSSAIVVRDPRDLAAIAWHADYLNPLENAEPNQVDKSLQTTRRFDALKLWATLRAIGADGLGDLFDRVLDLTQEVHAAVAAADDLELVSRTDLSTVLFRYRPAGCPDAEADRLVALIRRVLFESGRAHVAKTVIDGRPCLKLTLLNPETTLAQVLDVFDLVRAAGDGLRDAEHLDDLDLEEVAR